MRLWPAAVAATLMVGGLSVGVEAQNAPPKATQAEVDVSKLPLDLVKLQRELRESAGRPSGDASRLRFTVDVFGRAPRLQLITPEDNVRWGQPSYGAPTHREVMELVTPREFRSPVMDFSSLMRWIQQKSKSDSR